MQQYVCIDIGGTSVKYGLGNDKGILRGRGSFPTETRTKGVDQLWQQLIELVQGFEGEHNVGGIALAMAGIVDPETGEVLSEVENLGIPAGVNPCKVLSEACGVQCTLENDVNAAALGEYWRGAAKEAHSVLTLTIGTGIGGCLMLDGKLLPGASHSAGEIGCMRLAGEQKFEQLASMGALLESVAQATQCKREELDGERVFARALAQEPAVCACVKQWLHQLAIGISNACYLFNPELVVLGGGVSEQSEYLLPLLQQELAELLVPHIYQHTQLAFAQLKNDAGLIGALYNFKQRTGI